MSNRSFSADRRALRTARRARAVWNEGVFGAVSGRESCVLEVRA